MGVRLGGTWALRGRSLGREQEGSRSGGGRANGGTLASVDELESGAGVSGAVELSLGSRAQESDRNCSGPGWT